MRHVFIVGAKSLGAYGGYETFVNKLTEYSMNCPDIKYHVTCKANGTGHMDENKLEGVTRISDLEFEYHNAHCIKIPVPNIGPAVAIYYDIKSIEKCCEYIEKNHIEQPIIYILACRIGPWAKKFQKKIHALGGKVYLNPDGHEWMRAKWSAPIRKYWKISEELMVRYSDLVICDSKNIEKYIHECYDGKCENQTNPQTTFIAYGAETKGSTLADDDEVFTNWCTEKELTPFNYYLIVGRFVPENNYETIIKEFMLSNTSKDLAIITNVNGKFLNQLESRLHFQKDKRIKFVGTVYNENLLMKIRENAYAYFHGHEVGGTNPSLLEALENTQLNLLLDVGFNREVAEDSALYWTKELGDLTELINQAEEISEEEIQKYKLKAKQRINEEYTWEHITKRYTDTFMDAEK